MSIGLSSLQTKLEGLHVHNVGDFNKAVSAWQSGIWHYETDLLVPQAVLLEVFHKVKAGAFEATAELIGKYGFSSVWCNPLGDGLKHYTAPQSVDFIKGYNAMPCKVCHGSAHLLKSGVYQCMENPGHFGDEFGFVDDSKWHEAMYKDKIDPKELGDTIMVEKGIGKDVFKFSGMMMPMLSPKIDGIHPSGWTKFIGGFKKPKKQKKPVVIAPLLAAPKSKFGMMARAKLDALKKSQPGY